MVTLSGNFVTISSIGVTLPQDVREHNLIRMSDQEVVLVGMGGPRGNFVFKVLDIPSQSWSSLPKGPVENCFACVAGKAKLSNGHDAVIVTGHWNSGATFIFDYVTKSWSKGPDLPDTYRTMAKSVQFKDSFLIVGGHGVGRSAPNNVLYFNPQFMSWDEVAKLKEPHGSFVTAFLLPDEFCQKV